MKVTSFPAQLSTDAMPKTRSVDSFDALVHQRQALPTTSPVKSSKEDAEPRPQPRDESESEEEDDDLVGWTS